jgi:hypothetical protein
LFERPKIYEKSPSTRSFKKCKKMEPGTGGETRGAEGHKERLWRDRVRQTCPMSVFNIKKKSHGNGTSSASVAMCEAFFGTCAAYSHEYLPHTWDS